MRVQPLLGAGDLNRLCNANLVHKSILQNWVWKRGSGADAAGCFCLSRHGCARRSGLLGYGNCSIALRANRVRTPMGPLPTTPPEHGRWAAEPLLFY
jgi:hypothetical protein